jgi:hypothetical protein
MMIDYYVTYLEMQRKMRERSMVRAGWSAADASAPWSELEGRDAGTPRRHRLAEALRAAASRLDRAPV